jgi:protein-disulfide isomerase
MSSRAETKAAARRHRLALEAAQHRRRAVLRLGAVTITALALVAGAITVSQLGAEDPAANATPVVSRFAGVPQDGIALGAPQAPATLIEFADLQCPWCGVYGRDVLPAIVERYVRPGTLRLELNVLTFVGEDSVRAGRIAAAAAQQDRFWDFTDAFYASQGEENTGYVSDAFLDRTGTAARVDMAAARAAQDGKAATQLLSDAQAAADRLQVKSTPSFFVQRRSGKLKPLEISELTPQAFSAALDEALAR